MWACPGESLIPCLSCPLWSQFIDLLSTKIKNIYLPKCLLRERLRESVLTKWRKVTFVLLFLWYQRIWLMKFGVLLRTWRKPWNKGLVWNKRLVDLKQKGSQLHLSNDHLIFNFKIMYLVHGERQSDILKVG